MEPDRPSDFDLSWLQPADEYGTILDIGSYDGSDARRIKRALPSSRVIAIEPDPINFARLKIRNEASGLDIEPYNMALSDHSGVGKYIPMCHSREVVTDEIFDMGWRGSGGILPPKPGFLMRATNLHTHQAFPVNLVTLDEFCRWQSIFNLTVIHMDVQGAEGLVLSTLGDRRPRLIFLETQETDNYAGAWPLPKLEEFLHERGYVKAWQSARDALFKYER